MTKDNSKKTSFNFVDALIILLVLVCLVVIGFKGFITHKELSEVEMKEYKLSFKIDNIRGSSCKYFEKGDVVCLASNGQVIGYIDDIVQHVPAIGAYTVDGKEILYPEFENPNIYTDSRYSLTGYIVIKGSALEKTDNGNCVNIRGNIKITENELVKITTEQVNVQVKITEIIPLETQ